MAAEKTITNEDFFRKIGDTVEDYDAKPDVGGEGVSEDVDTAGGGQLVDQIISYCPQCEAEDVRSSRAHSLETN